MENKDERIIPTGDETTLENVSDISENNFEKNTLSETVEDTNLAESEKSLTDYNDEEDKIESINNILKSSDIVDKTDCDSQALEQEQNNENQDIKEDIFLQKPVKKKSRIKVPVIIASCILIGAIIGFLVFSLFFLHSPLGTWSIKTEDGITYYYTFEKGINTNDIIEMNNNNSKTNKNLRMTIGSIDYIGSYATFESDGKKMIEIQQQYGAFSGQYEYKITGSRIFGNQEFHLINGDQEYTLTRAKIPNNLLTVSEDFKEDKNLTGEWEHVFEDYGGLTYKFIFNKDGTMQINQYDTYIYNCTYTCDGSNIKCTFYSLEPVTEDIDYSCDGETLTIMGLECTRAGKSTVDQK